MVQGRLKMKNNLILMTDSYKFTHWKQYPPGTEYVMSYFESRGCDIPGWNDTVFFGLQYLLKEYFTKPITQQDIDEAEEFVAQHLGSKELFNREGWEHILNAHGGYLPLKIKAVPEGTRVPLSNVLMTVENTDPKCWWLTNYVETILVQLWYPITVASYSKEVKKILISALEQTGTPELIDFKFHDFGYRGVSSIEGAALGGAAHLLNFMGTDTVRGIELLKEYYEGGICGFSIPAAEHSTITSWGKENEVESFRNMLTQFNEGLVAVVSDSYDIYNACSYLWGQLLKEEVVNRKGTLVIRPDSGDPATTVLKVLEILGQKFGYTTNNKFFNVLPPYIRIIQGDGVNYESIKKILATMMQHRWSADNIAFGCGGKLLQDHTRDDYKFAFKCCNVTINGNDQPVSKSPVGDRSKASKGGRLILTKNSLGGFSTIESKNIKPSGQIVVTRDVFRNGKLLVDDNLKNIRERNS